MSTSDSASALRLSVVQFAPVLRDVPRNAAQIERLLSGSAADVVLTPELSLTGYDVGDSVHRLARPVVPGQPLAGITELAGGAAVVLGLIEEAAAGPFNTAVVLQDGRVRFRHRKLYLPTYGMFDEGRWFGRGRDIECWTTDGGWRVGLLICEDFWHPGLTYVLASRGIELLLVQAAAPGRGVWDGGAGGDFASADVWERIARTTAQLHGIYVALCNRVGVEGGVTFAGGSLVAGPDGAVLARAGCAGEQVVEVELSRDTLKRSRQPYAHARDDEPGFIARELMAAVRA